MRAKNWSRKSPSVRSNEAAAFLLLNSLLDENRCEKKDKGNPKREDTETVQCVPSFVCLACLLSKRTRRKAHHPIIDRYKDDNGNENDRHPDRNRCDKP